MARFDRPVALGGPGQVLPWRSLDGGKTWLLSQEAEIALILRTASQPRATTQALSLGDGLVLDMAVVGKLTLTGDVSGVGAIVSSIHTQLGGCESWEPIEAQAGPRSVAAGQATMVFAAGSPDGGCGPDAGPEDVLRVDRSAMRLDAVEAVFPLPEDMAQSETRLRWGTGQEVELAVKTRPVALSVVSERSDSKLCLNLLGPVRLHGLPASGRSTLTSQQLALMSYLACVGPVSGRRAIDALWSGASISTSRFPNLLAETRREIGKDHIPRAEAGMYRLVGVETDLDRLSALIGPQARGENWSTAELLDGLDLIRGAPFESPGGPYWDWVDVELGLLSSIEALVVQGAAWVASVCRARNQMEGAAVACERGLLAFPYDETLVIHLVDALVAMGRTGAAARQVASWEARVQRLGCGPAPHGPRLALRSYSTGLSGTHDAAAVRAG